MTQTAGAEVAPPFSSTTSIGSSVLTPLSPTDLLAVTATGTGVRTTFDRRNNGWVTQSAYLFQSTFVGTRTIEVIVNTEFGSVAAAQKEAERYSRIVGQLPRGCRLNIDKLVIHRGNNPLGGGNRSLLIHTDRAEALGPFIEEVLVHESSHTSLDSSFGGLVSQSAWDRAVAADPGFISDYARDYPQREDVASSFLPYLAWKLGAASGYTAEDLETIHAQIPNRLGYFDSLNIDLNPVIGAPATNPATNPNPAANANSAVTLPIGASPAKSPSVRWWGPFTTGRLVRVTFTPAPGMVYRIRASRAKTNAIGRCNVVMNAKLKKRIAKCTIRFKTQGRWVVHVTSKRSGTSGRLTVKTLVITARSD